MYVYTVHFMFTVKKCHFKDPQSQMYPTCSLRDSVWDFIPDGNFRQCAATSSLPLSFNLSVWVARGSEGANVEGQRWHSESARCQRELAHSHTNTLTWAHTHRANTCSLGHAQMSLSLYSGQRSKGILSASSSPSSPFYLLSFLHPLQLDFFLCSHYASMHHH